MPGLKKISLERIEEAMEEWNVGFCLSCGEIAYNVEPDAEKYKCFSCGEKQVYGAGQILIMGNVEGM